MGLRRLGTRFATFQQPGRPRDVFERIDDAAEVHRLTGTAPAVALHFPWDQVDAGSCADVEARGLRVGAVNPNLFQDPDYKLGSVTHPDAGGAPQGDRSPARVRGDRARAGVDRAVAVVRRRHQLPGPGRPARAPRGGCSSAWPRCTRRCPPSRSCCSSTSRSSRRSTRPTSPTGARRCSRARSSATARRCWSTSATTCRARTSSRSSRSCAPRAGWAASTSTTASTPTTT